MLDFLAWFLILPTISFVLIAAKDFKTFKMVFMGEYGKERGQIFEHGAKAVYILFMLSYLPGIFISVLVLRLGLEYNFNMLKLSSILLVFLMLCLVIYGIRKRKSYFNEDIIKIAEKLQSTRFLPAGIGITLALFGQNNYG